MAEYALSHSPSWGTVYASLNGDGTSTFWANSWLPQWGRLCNIARFLVSTGTIPTSGATLDAQAAPSGATLVGMGPTTTAGWPGGTLFAFLDALFTLVDDLSNDKLDKAGGTVTGPVLFSGSTARVRHRSVSNLTNADSTFGPTADVFVTYSAIGAGVTRTYTVNTSTAPAMLDGEEIRIINRGTSNATAQIVIAQEGGSVLGTFTAGDDYGWMVIGFDPTTNGAAPTAFVKSFGSATGTITLTNPYPLP
jgi:hypothetical protein